MALLEIPIVRQENSGWFYLFVPLDGIEYQLEFKYNLRGGFWTASISLTDNTEIVTNTRVNLNMSLFGRYVDDRLPKGQFLVTSTTGKNEDITLDNFGQTIILIYDDLQP